MAGSPPLLLVDARCLSGARTGVGTFLASLVHEWERSAPDRVVLLVRAADDLVARRTTLPLVPLGGPGPVWHLRAAREARRRGARYLSPDSFLVPSLIGRSAALVVHDLTPLLLPEAHPGRSRLSHRLFTKLGVRRVGAVITPSQTTADDVHALVPEAAPRLHVVPEAARQLPRGEAQPPVAEPYVLHVGTIEPRKNVLTLLRAFEEAAPSGWSLVLAGKVGWLDDTDRAELEHRAAPGGRVHHLGFVSDEDLDALYRGAGLFVYPSSYEGFGLPVLEAMSYSVPVLASDASALVEVGGDAVAYAPLADLEDGLVRQLSRLLGDEGARRALADKGQARSQQFSWADAAAEILALATG
jgi:alpha-1,3-rhamnosyl/mannosyltransferase